MFIELLSRKSIIGTFLMPFLFICPSLWANEPLWLSDDELSDVTGQALFNLQKIIGDGSSLGQAGYTFTRLSIGASIDVNANIDLIELGNYDIPYTSETKTYNAAGLDADIQGPKEAAAHSRSASNGWPTSPSATRPRSPSA